MLSSQLIVNRQAVALLVGMTLVVCAAGAMGAVVFTPPDDSVDVANEVKSIEGEMGGGNYAAASKRLDVLLAQHGAPLAALSDGTLTSISAWLDRLPEEKRKGLSGEWNKLNGSAAQARLDSLRERRGVRAEEFYALARRYPMTFGAGEALERGGDVSLKRGDPWAARAYFESARREGFELGEAREKQLGWLATINAGATLRAPADFESAGEAGAGKHVADGLRAFAGPLPFDATWFGNAPALGRSKFIPAGFGAEIVFASWKDVAMLRENGQVIWNWVNPKGPANFTTDRYSAEGHGALFAPATLCDVFGRPMIIVVRQPSTRGAADFMLSALRASDGTLIWATEPGAAATELSYSGLPAVCGGYVYSVAVAKSSNSSASLVLSALETTTGRLLWQTTLGSVTESDEGGGGRGGRKFVRNAPLAMEAFAEVSEPAVAGDLVLVAPNCGSLIAVGRFDGRIRWVSTYRDPTAANGRVAGGGRGNHWMQAGERERALLTRYKSTPLVCGDVAVVLPQDAAALYAFDQLSGRKLWESDLAIVDACGLAGASGRMAVACGAASIMGIDAGGTGKLMWKYTPHGGSHLTGPAVVLGETVLAPTSSGIVQLNVADGKEKSTYLVPDFRRFMGSDEGRTVAIDAGAAHSFGLPPAAR